MAATHIRSLRSPLPIMSANTPLRTLQITRALCSYKAPSAARRLILLTCVKNHEAKFLPIDGGLNYQMPAARPPGRYASPFSGLKTGVLGNDVHGGYREKLVPMVKGLGA